MREGNLYLSDASMKIKSLASKKNSKKNSEESVSPTYQALKETFFELLRSPSQDLPSEKEIKEGRKGRKQ